MTNIEIAKAACREIKIAAKEGRAVVVNVECEGSTKGFAIAGGNKNSLLVLVGMCESLKQSIFERSEEGKK